jgi:membrane-bound lytic murein transglycosylase D
MQSFHPLLLLALLSGAASGCDDAGKRPVQARVPVTEPLGVSATSASASARTTSTSAASVPVPPPNGRRAVTQSSAQALTQLVPLPLWARDRQAPASLLSPIPDGKALLIAKVEEKFASGEQNFKAGHLDTARRDFNDAIDWMLQSGYDPNSDPKLGEVFHRVVDTVYTYELQAFRAGDGFQETPAVPAPIDEVAEMTFPVDPRLKDRAEEAAKNISHDLPLTVNDEVLSFLNFFQTPRGKAIVETGLRRSGRYREMISRVLKEEGVPQDLIYLAQAESAFQPLALSRAGARGIWQFVPWRGNEYGLKRSWWVDERQDPEKATRAAAQHLRDLYGLFGDWYLAMAAYNCGPGNVQKGIEHTGYADFWELYRRNVLPRETKNYVPIIVALTLIAKDASHYGIHPELEQPVPSDVVKPGRAIDLRLVAETIDVDVETLRSLNPSLLRMATPDDPSFVLRLPKGTAEKFSAEIADIPPEKWVSWRRHRVEAGETLTSVAKKYHVTAPAIAAANSLGRTDVLSPGDKLIIPASQPAGESKRRLVRYRVRKGDTLGGIADQFSVNPEEIRKWNGLKTAKVSRGMVLRVYTLGGAPEVTVVRQRATPRMTGSTKKSSGKKASTVAAASSAMRAHKTP